MRMSYIVELLFSLLIFTVFVLGSFFILLFGANAYQSMVDSQLLQDENQMAIAYISTKIQQAPSSEAIELIDIDDVNCLVVEEVIDDVSYSSLVYYRDGALWELFTPTDRIDIEHATKVLEVTQVQMSKQNKGYYFEVMNAEGQIQELILNPR